MEHSQLKLRQWDSKEKKEECDDIEEGMADSFYNPKEDLSSSEGSKDSNEHVKDYPSPKSNRTNVSLSEDKVQKSHHQACDRVSTLSCNQTKIKQGKAATRQKAQGQFWKGYRHHTSQQEVPSCQTDLSGMQ